MRATNKGDQTSWKRFFQDAVLEADPRAFRESLETARKTIEGRLLEINSARDPNPLELAELTYAQRTVSVLQRRNSA